MGLFSSLTKGQKESIGLLQIGTFLEYFDLMLYVHMAVLLNELFFPKTDPHTAALLSAFAFCSTFVLRPFGALIFGYLGDNIGRKSTVIITTLLMSLSSLVMANLPTYAQIGISAAWVITICRMIQGVASMGEIVGAEIYLTETTAKPMRYPVVAFIAVASVAGTVMALVVASAFTSFEMNWRLAFWIGSGIAAVGSIARTRLRETPEFADMKRRLKNAALITNKNEAEKTKKKLRDTILYEHNDDIKNDYKKSTFFLFIIQCCSPICFYFSIVYCANILKSMGCTAQQIIHQNLKVTLVQLVSLGFVAYLSYRVHPLKILKVKAMLFFVFILAMPLLLMQASTPLHIFFIQAVSVGIAMNSTPGVPVFLSHLPILKRYTYASFSHAISRGAMYIVTSFGLIYLTEWFGTWGLWVVFLPAIAGFFIGIRHFEKLEFGQNHSVDVGLRAAA
ncbi:MAG: MFS transporter [Alphaproteobacteria bacterium]